MAEEKVISKWFRNKKTGMEWEIAHADTIRHLESETEEYEEIEAPKAPKGAKKAAQQE